jgi:hypothetical protein
MRTYRRLECLALAGAIALAAAGPSLALPNLARSGDAPVAVAANHFVELVARKGTRTYSAEEEGAAAATPTTTTTTTQDAARAKPDPAKALDDCMRTWDAGTHITQAHWKDICQRQANERGE